MALFNWSQTSSNNATADPTINWAEGQAPSTINDSARAMMSATAKYRDDIAGAIVTAGTSTAYTVASNSVFDTLAHLGGQMIAFSPHTTNGAGPVTLNVDGLGVKALRSAPNIELLAGTIVQGTPYVATYNNTDGAFYLQGFFGNPYNIPLGGMLPFIGSTAPNASFALPYGQAISRTTYATLFALAGTAFGAGDGSSTFNLPDLRGRVPVGLDNMGGTAADRVTSGGSGVNGTTIGASGGGEIHTLARSDLPNHALTFTGTAGTASSTSSNIPTNGTAIGQPGGSGLIAGSGLVNTLESTFTPAGTIENLNGNVAQTTLTMLQPSLVMPYILRII